jgi:hypothetical protein
VTSAGLEIATFRLLALPQPTSVPRPLKILFYDINFGVANQHSTQSS